MKPRLLWVFGYLALSACDDDDPLISGQAAGACTVHTHSNGAVSVRCPDGTEATVTNGSDGEPGEDGADGDPGENGQDGAPGEPGDDGEDGAPGEPGEDGAPGKDGTDGANGTPCTIVTESDGTRAILCDDGTREVLSPGKRRHVILIIGDGMQLAHEIAASRYLYGLDKALSFHTFSYQGFATTWDVSSYNTWAGLLGAPTHTPETFDPVVGYDPSLGGDKPYPLLADTPERVDYFFPPELGGTTAPGTDSASAATAMATGVKTVAANIAWLPGDAPGGAIVTSAERLRAELGMAIGIVTTVPFAHATPASFVSHDVHRDNYGSISEEILLETKPEVVIGAGHPFFMPGAPNYLYTSEVAYEEIFASTEYVSVQRTAGVNGGAAVKAAALAAVADEKKLFGLFGSDRFDVSAVANAPGAPDLTPNTLDDPSLADAAEAALTVLSTDPDGFFLVMEEGDIDFANHNHQYANMIASVSDLHFAVQKVTDFVDVPGDALDWSNTTVIVTADHGNGFMRFGPTQLGKGELPDIPESDYVTYGTTGHTNELVTLYARGAGADLFWHYANLYDGKALVDNTAVFKVTMAAAGVP